MVLLIDAAIDFRYGPWLGNGALTFLQGRGWVANDDHPVSDVNEARLQHAGIHARPSGVEHMNHAGYVAVAEVVLDARAGVLIEG